jgi:hypothetical protein
MANQKAGAKVGRNRKSGQNGAYKSEHRHEKSHIRRIKKHLGRYGVNDTGAVASMMKYAEGLGLHALNSAKEFVALQRAT